MLSATGPGEVVVPFMGDSVPDGNLAAILKRECFSRDLSCHACVLYTLAVNLEFLGMSV